MELPVSTDVCSVPVRMSLSVSFAPFLAIRTDCCQNGADPKSLTAAGTVKSHHWITCRRSIRKLGRITVTWKQQEHEQSTENKASAKLRRNHRWVPPKGTNRTGQSHVACSTEAKKRLALSCAGLLRSNQLRVETHSFIHFIRMTHHWSALLSTLVHALQSFWCADVI